MLPAISVIVPIMSFSSLLMPSVSFSPASIVYPKVKLSILLREATYADGTHTIYATSPSDYSGGFTVAVKSAGGTFNITNISVKEVLGKPGIMTDMTSADIVQSAP